MRRTSISIDDLSRRKLDAFAEKRGLSMSNAIRLLADWGFLLDLRKDNGLERIIMETVDGVRREVLSLPGFSSEEHQAPPSPPVVVEENEQDFMQMLEELRTGADAQY